MQFPKNITKLSENSLKTLWCPTEMNEHSKKLFELNTLWRVKNISDSSPKGNQFIFIYNIE